MWRASSTTRIWVTSLDLDEFPDWVATIKPAAARPASAAILSRQMTIGERAFNFVRPIYVRERYNALGQVGSATLARLRDRHFLITAAHCVRDLPSPALLACGERIWRFMEYPIVYMTPGDECDKEDVIVYEIPRSCADEYASSCQYLDLEETYPASKLEEGMSLFSCGFPCGRNRRHIAGTNKFRPVFPESRGYYANQLPATHHSFARDGYSPGFHIAFHYGRRSVDGETGESVLAVDPVGMSGGFVVAVYRLSNDPASETFQPLGIMIEFGDDYIVATPLENVLGRIINYSHAQNRQS